MDDTHLGERWLAVGARTFGVALFASAFLLFVLEPLIGKLVLPLLGGSPAVWNTCILFFQFLLLAGYAWTHLLSTRLPLGRQIGIHAALCVLSLVWLPIGLGASSRAPDSEHPVFWLLQTLAGSIGFPFFVLAGSGPLLQRWYSRSLQAGASDPYFLYAASNAGSLGGLLAYPALLEPRLPLHGQAFWWSVGYGLLIVLVMVCAGFAWRSRQTGSRPHQLPSQPGEHHSARRHGPPWKERWRWIILAAAPSSLLLGLTSYITTDLAAIPLLWVLPLAVYLLTFILSFSQPPRVRLEFVARWQPMLAVPLVIFLFWGAYLAIPALLPFHLLTFFATALVCHGRLAAERPPAERLTEYYLWIAVGGAAGGVFNVLLAPAIFSTVLEYPLVLALATGLGGGAGSLGWSWKALRVPMLTMFSLVASRQLLLNLGDRPAATPTLHLIVASLTSCLAAVACYRVRRRPLVLGASLVTIVVVGVVLESSPRGVLERERDFFGVHKVVWDRSRAVHILYSGTTKHGAQSTDFARRAEPLSYYSAAGRLGDVFRELPSTHRRRVGVVGLGTGAAAAYGRPGERWTFYELDPTVERIARDPREFTYLADSRAEVGVVIGDGRLSLLREPDAALDLLILDAFSSDAVPVHLLTRQAVAIYLQKLAPGGVLVFHLSNRYVDLEPIVGNVARDLGLAARLGVTPGSPATEVDPSIWAVVARREEDLGALGGATPWRRLRTTHDPVWTDEYSNVLTAMRIFRR